MSQIIILIICFTFSLLCSIIKQLHDKKYYKDTTLGGVIARVCLSAITGIIVSLIGLEYIENQFVLIGVSGLAGLFGSSTIKIITRFLLGQKVIRIQITDDDEPIEIIHNGKKLDDEIIDGIIEDFEDDKNV